ncbi:MAG TPA: hypothetical protein VMN77_12345 [Nitrospiria bacterium]|jgi:hypothetical protein|nr:hypothetical protein [Nitrospiria bacterium]
MLPEAYITHATKGRVRFKIPSKKGNRAFFSALKDKLPPSGEIPGVQRIEMNPATGSVLIVHDLDFKAMDLTIFSGHLEQMGLFKLRANGIPGTPVSQNIARTFKGVNQQIKDFTSGEVDLQSLALLGLLGLGLYQISRGQFMIPAISAFWYAATLLKEGEILKEEGEILKEFRKDQPAQKRNQ